MAEVDVYRLHLLSPIHLGERGVGMEESGNIVHSDTLFAALCWGLRQVAGSGWLEDWLAAFAQPPYPFLISSAFPWAGKVRFYPRPLVRPGRAGQLEEFTRRDQAPAKRLKGVNLVSEGIFQRLVSGQSLEAEMSDANFLPGGLWITLAEVGLIPEGVDRVWAHPDPIAHVALDRASNRSALYHVGEVRYAERCGLWFAVRWRDTAWRELLEMALSCLGEAGIGGERSNGRGQFRWDRWEGASLPHTPGSAGRAVTLSLYHPTLEEAGGGLLEKASYRLLLRRGWIASPEGQGLRSRAVRMLAEGSTIGFGGEGGDLADVTPEGFDAHRVYRYGLAFPLSVEVAQDG